MKYSTLLAGAFAGMPLAQGTLSGRADDDVVCIVGAGPAGLRAAHALEDQGRRVLVLDEKAAAGGKSQAFYEPGKPQFFSPMGALLLENTTYVEGRAVIARTNLPYLPAPHLVPHWSFDWRTGDTLPYPQLAAEQRAQLADEIQRYSALWQTQFQPLSAVGYRQGVPPALAVSTAEWLKQNNFALMPVLFNGAMFAYGYGDLKEVPIWYMLQYFTPTIVAAFAGSTTYELNAIDFHGVLVQYAAQLKSPVSLQSRVTKIERPEDGEGAVTVTYEVGEGPSAKTETQQCAQLVLAFPPTLQNLEKAGLAATPEETALFGAVRTNNYFSGAVTMAIPAGQLWYANSSSPAEPPADARGQPMGLLRLFPGSNLTATWSWSRGADTTKVHARRLLIDTLARINRRDPADVDSTALPFGSDKVHLFQQNDYFPHVSGKDLAGGFYETLDKLQGKKNTFYASGLNGYETVEFALRAGLDVVEHYMK